MKFKKNIHICRYDGITPFEIIMQENNYGMKCPNNNKGKCTIDSKSCKVIEYERKDK